MARPKTHQNLLESVTYTMFCTSSLTSKSFSTRTDPETDVTADATNATNIAAWRKRVMAVGFLGRAGSNVQRVGGE